VKKARQQSSAKVPGAPPVFSGRAGWFLASWRPYAIIALAVLAVYAQTIGFSFTNMDDTKLIVKSYGFNRDLGKVQQAFSEDVFHENKGMVYYRPLLTLSFMLDAQTGGIKPLVYHFSNVIIHLLAGLFLFWMLKAWGFSPGPGLAAALFFAVHPALSQAVAWIPGRNDSLLGLFLFASFGGFLKYCRQGRWFWLVFSMLSFAAALLTKETAVVMPVLGLIFLAMERSEMPRWRRLWRALAGWAAALAVWMLLRSTVPGPAGPSRPMINFIGDIGAGLLAYIGKVFLPGDLCLLRDLRDIIPGYGVISVLLLALALTGGLKNGKRFLFGGLWFLAFLLPTMLFVTEVNSFMDHRLYLPLAGVLMMLGELKIFSRLRRSWSTALLAVILTIFAGGNIVYSRTFRDDLVCWSYAVRHSPRSLVAHNSLGISYSKRNMLPEAEREYLAALRLSPDFPRALYNLGTLYLVEGKLDKAEQLLTKTLAVSSGFPEAAYNLGQVYERRGLMEQACRYYQQELKDNPGYADAYVSLGAIYQEQGKIEESRDQYRQALKLVPGNSDVYTNLGVISQQQGDWSGAERNYREALRIDPDKSQAHFNLGVLYQSRGMTDMARGEFDQALRLNPQLRLQVERQLQGR